MRGRYMIFEEMMRDERNEGRLEGRIEGKSQRYPGLDICKSKNKRHIYFDS